METVKVSGSSGSPEQVSLTLAAGGCRAALHFNPWEYYTAAHRFDGGQDQLLSDKAWPELLRLSGRPGKPFFAAVALRSRRLPLFALPWIAWTSGRPVLGTFSHRRACT